MEWVNMIIVVIGYVAAFIWGHCAGESKAYKECIERMNGVENCLLGIIDTLYQRLTRHEEDRVDY